MGWLAPTWVRFSCLPLAWSCDRLRRILPVASRPVKVLFTEPAAANGINSAAYYHVFKDANGNPLDGTNPQGYVLTFPAGQLPEAMRFWSLTAYTPEAIELVPNPANKYAVASYTPGLQPNPNTQDGPLSIYLARQLPAGVPMANWLPIPPGAFNIMLRVYGPEGTVMDNTYVPPGIEKR